MKSWKEFLEKESREAYFIQLMDKVNKAYDRERVYPSKEEMFSCFELCPYENVKVVIIGQDPYHGAGQAHGLSFSVKPGIKVPPSLKNIYKELQSDLNIETPNHGYLVSWAKQGVLMLNTSLTVTEGKPGSHKSFGWSKFTQRVLEFLNDYDKPLVFILWGNHAIEAAKGITNPKHFLIKSAHPSPLAGGGFFGTKPFSKTNEFLQKTGRGAIDWRIETVAEEPIGHNDKEEQDVVATTSNQWPPKFKTVWNNIKEVDTTNDVIISEYQGSPLKIIDLNGKQVLVGKYGNKLEFLDPYTFKMVAKAVILAPAKFDTFHINIVKIDGDWHAVYVIRKRDDREADDYFRVVSYNFTTKETTTIITTNAWIYDVKAVEINGINYLFLAVITTPGLILRYNLHTQQEELRFEIPDSDHIQFYYFISNGKPTLLVKHSVSAYLYSDYKHYKLFDAITGKQLGQDMTLTKVEDTAIVQVSDSKYVLAVATKTNHLHLFDTATGKQTHNILVDDDPNFTYTMAIYKSKLVIVSEDRTKIYDLAYPEQEPNILTHANGDPVQTKAKNNTFIITYQNKPLIIFPQDYQTNVAQCFSLETYTEEREIKVIPEISKFLPFTDSQNRELFIIHYGDKFNINNCITALYNPLGRIRSKEEYEFNYYAVTTDLNGMPVVVTRSNNNIFNLFNIETGQKIKCLKIESSETKVEPILITEVKGKQVLLASYSEDIKMFTFPEMEVSNISFLIEAAGSMDVIEMDGVKQLIAANDEMFTWNLETGEPIHNPFHVIIEPDAEEEEERYLCSDGFSIHTLNWGDKDSLFIGTVSSDAYIWNPHKPAELIPIEIDEAMWNVGHYDPDYCIYCAVSTVIDGKNVVVTGSHHGAVVVIDAETGERIGRIMKTNDVSEYYNNYMKITEFAGRKLLVTHNKRTVKIWTLNDAKKLKEFTFDNITSIAVSNNKIIVFHGEDVSCFEMI